MSNEQSTAQQRRLRILVLGDYCTDVTYILKKQPRANPENPIVPIYSIKSVDDAHGMAANVVDALIALDFAVVDHHLEFCGYKNRYYGEGGEYLFRIDADEQASVNTLPNLNWFDVFVISDYCKGSITPEVLHKVIETGKPVYIDTKKTNLADYSAPNVIFKINELEYDRMDHSAVFNSCNLVVTRGKYGSEWLKLNEVGIFSSLFSGGYCVDVVDVCSAGDMYLAGLVYGMHVTNGNKEKAMKIANAYAAISVQHLGTYIPSKEELYSFLNERTINLI